MTSTINRKELSQTLAIITKIVDKKSSLPALHNIVLTQENQNLVITATNLDQSVRAVLGQLSELSDNPIHCAINCQDFANHIRSIKKDLVSLSVDNGFLCIQGGIGVYKLAIFPVEDMPKVEVEIENSCYNFTTLAKDLAKTFESVSYCYSQDWTRPHINCVLLDWQTSELIFVATDGHRLAKNSVENRLPHTCGKTSIPACAIPSIEKLLNTNAKSSASIFANEKFLAISCGNCIIHTKLVEGDFPAYEQVIPQDDDFGQIMLSTDTILEALKACENKAPKDEVISTFNARFNELAINTSNSDPNFVPFSCAIPSKNSNQILQNERQFLVSIRNRYIAEAIETIDSASVMIQAGGIMDPIKVMAKNACHVIMPCRA